MSTSFIHLILDQNTTDHSPGLDPVMFSAVEEEGPAPSVVSCLTLVIVKAHRVTADVADPASCAKTPTSSLLFEGSAVRAEL